MTAMALAQSWNHDVRRERLREIIHERSVEFGQYTLASGRASKIFFDMKKTLLDPEGINLTAELVLDIVDHFEVTAIGGLIIGACPIVDGVCYRSYSGRRVSGFYVRKDRKKTGTRQLVEGPVEDGANVIVLDDVTTTGGSALEAVKAVRDELGCRVLATITIVDRQEGAESAFKENGIPLISLFTKADFVEERESTV